MRCEKCIKIMNNGKSIICDECKNAFAICNIDEALDFSNDSEIYIEFENYIKLRSDRSVIYAYSGGQDSTAVLFLLNQMCKKYNIFLKVFTIDNGYKGKRTWENIHNVIRYLNLEKNYKIYDIRKKIIDDEIITKTFGTNCTSEEIYALCFFNDILPCGKICNIIMDNTYKKILLDEDEEYLITGGDTPKINNGKYSVFWNKDNGLKIVRGGSGFRINKKIGEDIIKTNNIPWNNPGYGGYDTDCILPGSIFSSKNNALSDISYKDMLEKYPVVIEYLKERSRLKIIDRTVAIECLTNLDIIDYSGYVETKDTAAKSLVRRINKDVRIK